MDLKLLEDFTKHVLNEKLNTVLSEMRMAPDQNGYPLTRRQVERMLSQYERREDEDNWNDDPEYRGAGGWAKARWYPPELQSTFSPEDPDTSGSQRPAKLMPYDYYVTNYKVGDQYTQPYDVADDDDDKEDSTQTPDWSGETNPWS